MTMRIFTSRGHLSDKKRAVLLCRNGLYTGVESKRGGKWKYEQQFSFLCCCCAPLTLFSTDPGQLQPKYFAGFSSPDPHISALVVIFCLYYHSVLQGPVTCTSFMERETEKKTPKNSPPPKACVIVTRHLFAWIHLSAPFVPHQVSSTCVISSWKDGMKVNDGNQAS